MKRILFSMAVYSGLLLVGCTACKKEDGSTYWGKISQFDSDKLLVSAVVTTTANGFGAVFENLITDSLKKVEFCRVFTDPVRYFTDLSGYFFTQDFNGWNIAYPTNKTLQGTYLWNLQDPEGNYFIRTMTATAKDPGYGFVEYYWNNPASGENEKKQSYICAIPGIDYYIGSGFYIRSDDPTITLLESNKEISKNAAISFAKGLNAVFTGLYPDSLDRVELCRVMMDPLKFFEDNSGYFFVVDLDGNVVSHGGKKTLENTNVYDLQDTKGLYFIREMITLAKSPGYGFLEYYWNNPATGKDEKKMTYVLRLTGIDYFIGTGVYIQ
jgi:signal transduction histidine kinase